MKRLLTGVLTVAITAASLPVTALAADHSDPVTKNGEKLKYNTPYYLKDKNLSHKGGVIFESWTPPFEPWTSYDYARFSDSSTDNGIPVIFENKDKTDGIIQSDDVISIKSTKSNESGWQYWTPALSTQSVYLSDNDKVEHRIYGSSTDNSIGIGLLNNTVECDCVNPPSRFWEYKGENTEKAWMKPDLFSTPLWEFPPLNDRQTPLEVSEISE
ncbi:hypothetical protein PVK73_31540 [Bacillus thuringiensis]